MKIKNIINHKLHIFISTKKIKYFLNYKKK